MSRLDNSQLTTDHFIVVKIDIVTIFPKMVEAPLAEGIVGRAIERGLLDMRVHDLRDFTTDRHRVVDDMPFGGGPGHGDEARAAVRAVERIRGGARVAGGGRADVAGRAGGSRTPTRSG